MSEWKETTLGEIAEIVGGGTPNTSITDYWNGDIAWLTPRDLTGYTRMYITSGERRITKKGYKNSSTKLLPKGSVLFTSRAPIGYVAIADGELCTNQGFKSLILNGESHNKFIYYWLINNRAYLQGLGTGTTFAEISGSVMKEINISIPPLYQQKAIAEVLSSLDDKIDLLSRQNKTLEALASTYFRQWFIEEANEDWEETQLVKLGKIVCGKTPSTKVKEYFCGNIPFIKIPDMHGKVYVFNSSDTLSEWGAKSQSNKTIPPFSINVSCIATVGLVTMNVYTSQTNQQINTIIPYDSVTKYYLFLFLKNHYEELQALGSGGTMTLNINTTLFGEIALALPPKPMLDKFNAIIAPLFDKILKNSEQIQTLQKLRDSLLPKLISGEARVAI